MIRVSLDTIYIIWGRLQNTVAGIKSFSVQYLLRVIAFIFLADVLGLEPLWLPLLGFFSKMHSSFLDLHRLFGCETDHLFGGVNRQEEGFDACLHEPYV